MKNKYVLKLIILKIIYNMTKLSDFYMGINIIERFCKINNIKIPNIIKTIEIPGAGYYEFNKPNTIFIDINKCDKMTKKNNPMMIYESTVIGTMLHEFGHYIHFKLFPYLTKKWVKIKNEPHIHYYQMSIDEDIAECMRLCILNPTIIKNGRINRFNILAKLLILDVVYTPIDIVKTYNKKYEKVDIDKWELFLV